MIGKVSTTAIGRTKALTIPSKNAEISSVIGSRSVIPSTQVEASHKPKAAITARNTNPVICRVSCDERSGPSQGRLLGEDCATELC